jgi:hypothetical protein
MFLARSAESLGELLDRAGRDVVVVRRTPGADYLVTSLPETIAADLTARELAEAFG